MKKRRFLLLIVPALIVCACFLGSSGDADASAADTPAAESHLAQPTGDEQTLFPELNPSLVTAVSIITPQSTFDLKRDENRSVSINGQRGDREVFATLLTHIAAMSFRSSDSFTPPDTPLLTLIVHQQGREFSAAFYADGGTGEFARVVTTRSGSPAYGTTDGWHIGTLMLACEGTRIQDESGKETPF